MVNVHIDTKAVEKYLTRLVKENQKSLRNGSKTMGDYVLTRAKTSTCPEDTGRLRASIRIDKVADGYDISANTPYALVVHEKPANYSKGGTHYLSRPAVTAFNKFYKDIKREVFSGGGRT